MRACSGVRNTYAFGVPKPRKQGNGLSINQSTLPTQADKNELPPKPESTARFELLDDGTIAATGAEREGTPTLAYHHQGYGIWLYQGNCLELLDAIARKYPEGRFDCIFADPPYFLSNGGITCHAGKMAKVDKGRWDKSQGADENHFFNRAWLQRCQRVLKPNGTIWVSGTLHVIFSIGFAMQQLGFRILNDITWEKPNPPPNLGCRCFTHSTETVLWAARDEKSQYTFHYDLMRQLNRGKQMKTVWTMTAASAGEKELGRHPTQKPLALVERCLLASTNEGDCVLDPFLGSGTTAVASVRNRRQCIGIEAEQVHALYAERRVREAISNGTDLFSSIRPAIALA